MKNKLANNHDEINRKVKGILCDVDGVIFDTEVFQYFATAMSLNHLLGEQFDPDIMDDKEMILTKKEYKENLVGNSTKLIAKRLILKYQLNSTLEDFLNYRTPTIHNLFDLYNVKMIPGAKKEVMKMIQSPQYKFALATGGSIQETQKKFEKSGMLYLLEENEVPIVGFDTPGVNESKPKPDTYLVAAEMLSLEPKDCCSIEDTIPGIMSAKTAGIKKENNFAVSNWWTEKKDFSIASRYNSLKEVMQVLYEK